MTPTPRLLLDRLRPRAERWALWMEHQWAKGRTSPDQGLSVTSGEVARILEAPGRRAAEFDAFARHGRPAELAAPIADADRALAADPGWSALCARFAIPPPEQDLLALALADALDPDWGRVIGYLNDDTRQNRATPWLAARLCGEGPDARAVPAAPTRLLSWRLVAPLEGLSPLLPATPFQADPAVLASLCEGAWVERSLEGIAGWLPEEELSGLPVLHRAEFDRLLAAGRPLLADLLGPDGVGRRILAAQAAAAAGRRLLVVDCAALVAAGSLPELVVAVLRLARASAVAILWRNAEALPRGAVPEALARDVDQLRALPPDAITRPDALVVSLEKPALEARLGLWRAISAEPAPIAVRSQRLTADEVALVAAAAPHGADAMRRALRRTPPPDGELLSRLPCPYAWDDLVVPPELAAQLRELETHVRLRFEVYENWGFSRLAHLGCGIAALFAGASGTGKTMAAQVLARELDLDLYRVDLAGVVSKYIGETEKRLRDVFAFGERAGAILFFDEADALFGSRTQVKDSHDRFANIEIDYLLQRVERFDGIAILATNRKSDVDAAFLRRLRFVVDFIPPGAEERRSIWRRALPEEAPSGERLLDVIEWDRLATQLEMTGAEIKAAALGAAFLARGEGGRIGMRHVLAATQRELAKRGRMVRLRFTEATGT